MSVIGVFNIKGGVGKTSSAVNLAYLSARAGLPTLLWDLDPQGAASFVLRTRPRVRGGARRLIEGRRTLDDLVRGSDFERLDVVPADLSNRKVDAALHGTDRPERALLHALEPAREEYEHVFLDCAPALSGLSESLFFAVELLLCPTVPTPLSLRTLAQLMQHLGRRQGPRPLVRPFFCMVDRRKALHRETCDWAAAQGLGFLEAAVPYASEVEQMSSRRTVLFEYAPRGRAAGAYRALWDELRVLLEQRDEGPLYAKATRKALERAARQATNGGLVPFPPATPRPGAR